MLVQRGAPDALRGRAFAVLMSASYLVLGLGMIVAGPFINEFGARIAWIVSSRALRRGGRHRVRAPAPLDRGLAAAALVQDPV